MISGKRVLQAEGIARAKAPRQECAWYAGGTARRVGLSLGVEGGMRSESCVGPWEGFGFYSERSREPWQGFE